MRRAWLVLSALALVAPSALGVGAHVPDPAGDVLRLDDVGEAPAELPGADVHFVGVARGTSDARVTVGYGAPIPVDLELSLVLQVGPRPSDVAVVEVWRRSWDRGPTPSVAFVPAGGGSRVVEARAAFAEDAVQLVLPAEVVEGQACFELRSLRSTHHAEDGARLLDVVEPAFSCAATAEGAAPQESVAAPAGPGAYAPPREVRVPAPGLALGVVAMCVAVGLSRRR